MRAALLAILMLGCGAALHDQADLSEAVQMFNDGVRWERFTAAAAALPPRERAQFVDDMDQRSGDVKITEYEILRVDPRGEREARVQIKLSWYKASEGTVHETHALQTWERHGKGWWMVDEARLRGAPMPGLAEPPEPPATPVSVMKD
ncbi:MAG TPA: hypothetical protein VHT91_09010 [Kofleriaceae bacterium]|jgi:hypothetical protein|nr:hypothetical protein [Kofleriaceae bacterium]